MASTRGRKRARAESIVSDSGQNPDALGKDGPNDTLEGEDTAPGVPRRYSTRHSTQVSHPGIAAGLAKRHKTDIQAEATKKKADEAAKREKKEKREAAKAAREREGTKKLAAMLDERAREELQQIQDMERTPSSDDDARARDAGSLADEGANDGKRRSIVVPNIDDDHHDDDLSDGPPGVELPRQSRSSPISISSYFPEDSDSSLSDSDDGILEQPVRPTKKGKDHKSSKAAKTSQNTKTTQSATHNVGHALAVAPTKKKKVTETERRVSRIQKLRNEIASSREVAPTKTANMGLGHKPAGASRSGATNSKGKVVAGDAFTADFRTRARTVPRTPASKSGSSPTSTDLRLTFIGDTPASSGVARSQQDEWAATTFNFIHDTRTSAASEPTPLSDEELGGLDDADAATPVPTRVQKRSLAVVRGPAKNTMVGVLPMSLIEGDEVVGTPKKQTRAPRTKLSIEQSRGLPALAMFIQASMISTIIPSLIKYFGALDNPWDDDQFAAIFSSLLKKVHPVRASSIVKGDKEWRYARQGVYDWRSNFGKLAIRLVTKTAKALGSPTAISVWANNALARGGEATYSHPDVQHPKDARGALHTKLHIQLLASHYSVAEGAIIETSYPVGALSLANVAIRRAFTAFKSGTFIAQDGFTGNKYGDATMQTRKGSVKGLEGIPHRFDGLVAMAMAELPSFKRAEAENVEQAANDEDAYAAVDPPTSPPAADQY